MRFFKTIPGLILAVLLVAVSAVFAWVTFRVHRATHPPRHVQPIGELASALVKIEEVRFDSADGIDLVGWLLEGRSDLPPILLCHDLGAGKATLMNLAMELKKVGFTVLCFDFRGHGDSGGSGSGLGIAEKRDILGAVDYLAERSPEGGKPEVIGLYGVGIGAHAAVLAAADRPAIRVLVLDGLHPDASRLLVRKVYGDWKMAAEHLEFLPRAAYSMLTRNTIGANRAADQLTRLVGRDMLMVAPAGDAPLATAMQEMYRSVPEQQDADANLITLPSTGTGTLYGKDLGLYHRKVIRFLAARLGGPELAHSLDGEEENP